MPPGVLGHDFREPPSRDGDALDEDADGGEEMPAEPITDAICWDECWGKEPKPMRYVLKINHLASIEGGVSFRLMPCERA